MTDMLDAARGTDQFANIRAVLDDALVEDPETGRYQVRRSVFTDEQLFELEMTHIFEGNWIYLAHESQIPNVGDYFTTYMGRQPIVITRNKDGELGALINACSHRGAMLCRRKTDNRTTFTCPFHGWTFNNSGKLLKAKDARTGGYPEQFNKDGSHDLTRVARFENYRGFLFGSLNPDVLPLEEHLGDTTKVIDMIVDQSPDGLEVLRGASTYTYDGNWKLQTENGADGYHVSSTHWNYAATTARRTAGESSNETKAMDAGTLGQAGRWILLLRLRPPPALDVVGAIPRTDPCSNAKQNWRLSSVPRRPNSWSVRRGTSACIRTSTSWISSAARSGTSVRSPWTRPKSPSTASRPRERAPKRAATASVSTRTSSMPAVWPPRTISKSSVPARRPTRQPAPVERPQPWCHTPDSRSERRREGSRHESCALERSQDRGRRLVSHSARVLARRHACGRRCRASRFQPDHLRTIIMTVTTTNAVALETVQQFLYREARYLDDREFEKWIECYHPDSEYWMPAWADDGELTTDPAAEISLIYYPNRGGIEDRVFRIRTDRSSATSLPEPRTGHNITNVEVIEERGFVVDVRFNWFTLYFRYNTVDTYFGTSHYTIDFSGEQPLIMKEEGSPQERLHPSRGRHLPLLTRLPFESSCFP